MIRIFFITILLILFSFYFAFPQSAQQKEIEILYHQSIPARDGVLLSATIIKPKINNVKLPALFMLTPYTADLNQINGSFFAKNGYVVITVDTRGRGNSGGTIQPFSSQDGRDGYDVCKWITSQSWSDGQIGMFGGSYLGMVQWLTLKENPPGLKTIVPTASVCPGIDFPKRNNIYYSYVAPYLAFISGKTANRTSFSDIEYWNQIYRYFYSGKYPYSKMTEISGIKSDDFALWLKHPLFDDYWKSILPSEKDYKNFKIPILTITGYYDDDQAGALYYYSNHLKFGGEDAKNNHYLLMGPWDHSGTRRPQKSIGELYFGDNAVIDMNQLQLEWFNWVLKSSEKPAFLKDRVTCFTMGSNDWFYEKNIADLQTATMLFYLGSSNGMASDIFHSGYLLYENPNNNLPDTFRNDPAGTPLNETDLAEGHLVNYALYNNSEPYKGAGLIYHSNPIDKDIIVAGFVKLHLSIAMDVKDADFEMLLYEILPNGNSLFLTSDILRARFRNGLEKEDFAITGSINTYVFSTPYLFIRKINSGSRIRLVIRNLNSPHYGKNFQSGGNILNETAEDSQKGTFLLFHNNAYKSFLEIPVYKIVQ